MRLCSLCVLGDVSVRPRTQGNERLLSNNIGCRTQDVNRQDALALKALPSKPFLAAAGQLPYYELPRGVLQMVSNGTKVTMRKRDIHGGYYKEAKVYCKGEHVMTLSGTQESYQVDIWSGNHPYYQGAKNAVSADDGGPLSKFLTKYEGLEDLMEVPTLQSEEVEGLDSLVKKRKKQP